MKAARTNQFHWALFIALVVTLSVAAWSMATRAEADVRRTTPRAHFKSGAARQETVLREILAQLKKTDARLAKIESFVDKLDRITQPEPKKPPTARGPVKRSSYYRSAPRNGRSYR